MIHPLLRVHRVTRSFERREGRRTVPFDAVRDVSFEILQGECVGLIGESGSGKSTLSRIVAGLQAPSNGFVLLDGQPLSEYGPKGLAGRPERAMIQMVFQDPDASLNPSFTVARCIADPLARMTDASRSEIRARVLETAQRVGLDPALLDRRPHQLSGGQKARVGIARALAARPRLLILDEPTAALDVSVQAVIMKLLGTLRRDLGMSYLFVSHDLELVKLIADRVAVMKSGEMVEYGDSGQVLGAPQHAYTRALLRDSRLSGPTPEGLAQ